MKTPLVFTVIISLFFCFACNTNKQKSSNDDIDEATIIIKKDTPLPAEQYQSTDYAEIGWELMAKESFGTLKLEMDSAELIRLLGVPDVMTPEEFWGADGGFHCSWEYKKLGVILGLNRVEDHQDLRFRKKLCDRITLTKISEAKTQREIGIGSTKVEVLKAYTKAIENEIPNNGYLVAGTVYGGLMFKLEGDVVVEMFLGAMAE